MDIKTIEKEMKRIFKITKLEIYNPLDIFAIRMPFSKTNFKQSYKRLVKLIHPDKIDNNSRFCEAFRIVCWCKSIIEDKRTLAMCIKAKKTNNLENLRPLFERRADDRKLPVPNLVVSNNAVVKYTPKAIVKRVNLADVCDWTNIVIQPNIAVDGAEHTKNKCKSKADKHQKGLKQRSIQNKAAIRRIKNHNFSFRRTILNSINELKRCKQ